MKLHGIKNLYYDMKKKEIDRYRFDYKNGKGNFDIFFFIDEKPFILLFGAKGANFSFEIKVQKGFEIDPKFDKDTYYKLIEFLELTKKEGDPFTPFKFFLDFDKKTPTIANLKNKAQAHDIIQYRRNVEEEHKIYFWRWKDNTINNENVSLKNLEKTKKLLGIKAYKRCKEKNISSQWTDDINKRKEFYMPK